MLLLGVTRNFFRRGARPSWFRSSINSERGGASRSKLNKMLDVINEYLTEKRSRAALQSRGRIFWVTSTYRIGYRFC